ncbi:MAG: bifunctional tetrahydrofolate synthase/dihydrofolate synthase [Gammaproteobacteria bacterium]
MPRSLDEWLAYQTSVHPQAIDLGLDRPRQVLERLGWRQPTVPVITVAGTNGKGSVSGYCAAVMAAADLRVGMFTSPHLRDYRERIRVHDRLADADELVAVFERIEHARGTVGLTFFEFNTLAALLIFEAARLDAWVLEIGMGGRLDAVNVVDPDVAVVVSIGFDHQEYLGATLNAIGREKAGIFRAGRPAILGSREMPSVVADAARVIGAPLKRIGIEYSYEVAPGGEWHFRGGRWDLRRLPAPALAGETQYANAATALAALEEIDARLKIPATAVAQGLTRVQLAARFQVIAAANTQSPTWILDVAHNPAAARVLAHNLRALLSGALLSGALPSGPQPSGVRPNGGRTLAVFGILADKDASGVVAELRDSIDAWWCIPTDGERGRSGASLAEMLRQQVAVPVEAAVDTAAGCRAALAYAEPRDRIVVFGSFHTVGPVLDWLEAHDLLPQSMLPEYTAAPRGT